MTPSTSSALPRLRTVRCFRLRQARSMSKVSPTASVTHGQELLRRFFVHRHPACHLITRTKNVMVILLFNKHHQCSNDYERKTERRFFTQVFLEYQCRETDGDKNTQLIDGDNDACKAVLQCLVVA